jgi:protein-serine/threonine kinase
LAPACCHAGGTHTSNPSAHGRAHTSSSKFDTSLSIFVISDPQSTSLKSNHLIFVPQLPSLVSPVLPLRSMAIPESAGDSAQADGEGESPDQPSPSDISKKLESLKLSRSNPVVNGTHPCTSNPTSQLANFPLPAADSLLMGVKQPGLTRGALERLTTVSLSTASSSSSDLHKRQQSQHSPSSASPVPTSPTDSAPPSRGPSRPPSQPASRAPSMSAGRSGGRLQVTPLPDAGGRERRGSQASDFPPPTPINRRPSSVHSDRSEGGGHKFNLRDLLGSGPRLNRKSSQRSTSSRKSDSDTDGRPRSATGESTASMSQKYGVCQKVAIGKGATSVVRLAHKWDRSEEKLYAIKEFRKRRKNETEKEYVKKLTAEFCISSTLHHPNVVETVDLIQDENQHWCEVMEFCPGGDLYAAIKKG